MKKRFLVLIILVVAFIWLVLPSLSFGGGQLFMSPQCRDKLDNDGDGYIDYPNDPGCSSKKDASELNPNIECDDGKDNDLDGKRDLADLGCSSPTDKDETNCGDAVCEGGETDKICKQDCASCADTDGGISTIVKGTTAGQLNNAQFSHTDSCIDTWNVTEYYCSASYEKSQAFMCAGEGYGYTCNDGRCLFTNRCNDTEVNGQDNPNVGVGNLYIQGTVYGTDNGINFSYTDFCLDSSVVTDYYCLKYKPGSNNYNCVPPTSNDTRQYICSAGVCIPKPSELPSDSCNDTDGGFVITSQGVVSGYLNGQSYTNTDYCISGDNSSISTSLREYYCSGTSAYSSVASCITNTTASCNNGACA